MEEKIKYYFYETELDKINYTIENMIPNAIVGKLKSENLICRDCNSSFGNTLDFELVAQLNMGKFVEYSKR